MNQLLETLAGILPHSLVLIASVVALIYLYRKFLNLWERVFGQPFEIPLSGLVERRNRPITIFGDNDGGLLRRNR